MKSKKTFEIDSGLLERLKKLRVSLANRFGVPTYSVFHERTLQELAAYCPTNFNELSQIYGLGEVKINRYGQDIIDEIKKYKNEKTQ